MTPDAILDRIFRAECRYHDLHGQRPTTVCLGMESLDCLVQHGTMSPHRDGLGHLRFMGMLVAPHPSLPPGHIAVLRDDWVGQLVIGPAVAWHPRERSEAR